MDSYSIEKQRTTKRRRKTMYSLWFIAITLPWRARLLCLPICIHIVGWHSDSKWESRSNVVFDFACYHEFNLVCWL